MRAPAKYLFDLDFSTRADQRPAEPAITLAEHAVRLAEAEANAYRNGFAAAETQGLAHAQRSSAAALERIGAELERLGRGLAAVTAQLEAEAVEVAVAVAGKLAPELLAREPFAEIAALVRECFRELVAAPHVVVRVNEGLHATACDRLEEITRRFGFEGRLVVLAEPEIALGDCRLEWADGGVTRDRAAIEAVIGEAVARYVAARLSSKEAAQGVEGLRQ
jgi:flagellar assembly protein FliH